MMTSGTWTQMLSRCERLAFDSNALIYFLEGYPRYSDRVAEALSLLEQGRAVGFVSTMVEMELQVLPMRDNDKRRLMTIAKFFRLQPNLFLAPLDSTVAGAAARVRASTGMKAPDAIIEATAVVTRCDAIIGNDRGFAKRSELPYLLLDDFTT